MGTVTISPSQVRIGDTITFNATGLVANKDYCVGAHISWQGFTWCVVHTSDAAGSISGTYLIGENLAERAKDIDEFAVRELDTGIVVAYTTLTIVEVPPPKPPIPTELLILGGIAAIAVVYYLVSR